MRNYMSIKSLIQSQQRGPHSLRTSLQSRPRVIQLSNVELLDIVKHGKEDTVCTTDSLNGAADSKLANETVTSGLPPPLVLQPPLPQSPLTDRKLIDARNRYRGLKSQPGPKRLAFQVKLEKNPYGKNLSHACGRKLTDESSLNELLAQALSTSPRLCLLTGAKLPSYFQISFGLATHPETGAPWHLPRASTGQLHNKFDLENKISEADPLSNQTNHSRTLNQHPRTLSGSHFLASHHIFAYVSSLGNSAYRKLVPYRWKENSDVRISDLVWREDMDIFVLNLLRNYCVQDLKYLSSRTAAYIVACKTVEGISIHDQVSAVLRLGSERDASLPIVELGGDVSPSEVRMLTPPPYAMHRYKSHYIPYYDLSTLLGSVKLQNLKESNRAIFGGPLAVIKAKRNTVHVQMKLWKLLGYIAGKRGQ